MVWSVATRVLIIVWALTFLSFLFVNVLPHFSIEKLLGLIALFALLAFASCCLFFVFGLFARMKRAFRWSLLLALGPLLFVMALTWGVPGALIVGFGSLGALLLTVGAASALFGRSAEEGPLMHLPWCRANCFLRACRSSARSSSRQARAVRIRSQQLRE